MKRTSQAVPKNAGCCRKKATYLGVKSKGKKKDNMIENKSPRLDRIETSKGQKSESNRAA